MNIDNFNFISEGRTERVLFVDEGATTGFSKEITVPFSDLLMVRASISLDGISWYSDESPRYADASTGPDLSISAYSAANRIKIFTTMPSGATAYYRVVGTEV